MKQGNISPEAPPGRRPMQKSVLERTHRAASKRAAMSRKALIALLSLRQIDVGVWRADLIAAMGNLAIERDGLKIRVSASRPIASRSAGA